MRLDKDILILYLKVLVDEMGGVAKVPISSLSRSVDKEMVLDLYIKGEEVYVEVIDDSSSEEAER